MVVHPDKKMLVTVEVTRGTIGINFKHFRIDTIIGGQKTKTISTLCHLFDIKDKESKTLKTGMVMVPSDFKKKFLLAKLEKLAIAIQVNEKGIRDALRPIAAARQLHHMYIQRDKLQAKLRRAEGRTFSREWRRRRALAIAIIQTRMDKGDRTKIWHAYFSRTPKTQRILEAFPSISIQVIRHMVESRLRLEEATEARAPENMGHPPPPPENIIDGEVVQVH